ncbi:restriction endonuclease subunit S [Pseudactinotalea sp. HY160]|uniref:restriction endonuclease subunit S n=1 Tax=Pseudactinotalea sp. HY160 TaxID=2654490 RepID=UPI001D156048|nr:restriction endonuclease subunit S [Pseudactinotalea sp. HY160]
MIRGSNLSFDVGTRLDEREFVYLPEEYAARFERSLVREGDLVFTCWGSVGQIGLIGGGRHVEYMISNKQMKMTPDRALVDSTFLYYYLSQPTMIALVQGSAIGSSVPGFNLGQLKSLPVTIPAMPRQRAIARVLSALDDKIEANRRLAVTADELAHLRFRMMVRGSEAYVPLSATARFINGKAFTKNATGSGRVVIRIAEMNSGLGSSTVRNDLDVHDDHLARPGDLLFAWSGSLTLARWYRDEGIVNQHIFKVIPNEGYPLWLVNQLIRFKLEEFRAIAADKATTMGHIQRRHLDEAVTIPDAGRIVTEDKLMSNLWKRALAAEVETERLIAMRDTLLPKLMSGDLRVREAEAAVAEAV